VDNCLTLGVALGLPGPYVTDYTNMIHSLYHYKRGNSHCVANEVEAMAEVETMTREPPYIDIASICHTTFWSTTLWACGNIDRVCDLLFGRMRLLCQLDVAAWIGKASAYGIKMHTVGKREARPFRKMTHSFDLFGLPNVYAIAVTLPSGVQYYKTFGSLLRMIVDAVRPNDMFREGLESEAELREMGSHVVK
jgi:hypothetical protein